MQRAEEGHVPSAIGAELLGESPPESASCAGPVARPAARRARWRRCGAGASGSCAETSGTAGRSGDRRGRAEEERLACLPTVPLSGAPDERRLAAEAVEHLARDPLGVLQPQSRIATQRSAPDGLSRSTFAERHASRMSRSRASPSTGPCSWVVLVLVLREDDDQRDGLPGAPAARERLVECSVPPRRGRQVGHGRARAVGDLPEPADPGERLTGEAHGRMQVTPRRARRDRWAHGPAACRDARLRGP